MEYREKVYIFQAEIRRISWRSKKYAPNDERSLDSTKKSIYSARSIFSFDSKKVFYIMPRNYVFLWQISSQKHFKSSNISSGRPIKKLDDISRLLWWLSSSWRHFAILGYIFSNSLTSIRAQFPHTTTTTADTPATQEDLNNFLDQYLSGQVTASGETASGDITTAVTSSGLTITATNTGETETGATEVQ